MISEGEDGALETNAFSEASAVMYLYLGFLATHNVCYILLQSLAVLILECMNLHHLVYLTCSKLDGHTCEKIASSYDSIEP